MPQALAKFAGKGICSAEQLNSQLFPRSQKPARKLHNSDVSKIVTYPSFILTNKENSFSQRGAKSWRLSFTAHVVVTSFRLITF